MPLIQLLGGQMMGFTVSMLLGAAAASALAMVIFESRGLLDLGLAWREGTPRNLVTGAALGIGAACLAILPAITLGAAHFQNVVNADASWRAALFMPLLLFCGAVGEEIAFRGFILQFLMRGWGAWVSILVVAAVFGWGHNANPSATLLSDVNTAVFGALFGCALLRSHDLWFPIGLHFGWNLTLPFLGVPVSGLTIRVAGYELVWNSSDLWSGGKYGPEGSVLTSAVLAILFLAVWKIPVRRGWAYLLDEPAPSSPSSAQV